MKTKQQTRARRKARSKSKIIGTAECPRLSVFRSLSDIYAQLIDDVSNKTIISASARNMDEKIDAGDRAGKSAIAYKIGHALALAAKDKKVEKVIFDRSGYKYHGRVKALAEGAREGGLKF